MMAPSMLIHMSRASEAALKYVTSQLRGGEAVDWYCQVLADYAEERKFTGAFGTRGEAMACVVRKRRKHLRLLVLQNELTVSGDKLLSAGREVIPFHRVGSVLDSLHSSSSHQGMDLWIQVREQYVGIIREDVRQCVTGCSRCHNNKVQKRPPPRAGCCERCGRRPPEDGCGFCSGDGSTEFCKAETLLLLRAYEEHPHSWGDIVFTLRENLRILPMDTQTYYRDTRDWEVIERLEGHMGRLMAMDDARLLREDAQIRDQIMAVKRLNTEDSNKTNSKSLQKMKQTDGKPIVSSKEKPLPGETTKLQKQNAGKKETCKNHGGQLRGVQTINKVHPVTNRHVIKLQDSGPQQCIRHGNSVFSTRHDNLEIVKCQIAPEKDLNTQRAEVSGSQEPHTDRNQKQAKKRTMEELERESYLAYLKFMKKLPKILKVLGVPDTDSESD